MVAHGGTCHYGGSVVVSGARRAFVVLAAFGVLAAPGGAEVAPIPQLQLVGMFDSPIYATAPLHEDHLLFVVERPGRIRVVRDGVVLPQPFLDISGLVSENGEGGLLSVAFPPRYWQTGRFVVYYTDLSGSIQIVEYRRTASNPELADPTSARPILTIPHPGASNHYGGSMQFGPDGLLYVGTGDGGGAGDQFGNSRNLGSLLGKLLRIDPFSGDPYAIPMGNPFVGVPGARPEIFAYGLRNPGRDTAIVDRKDVVTGCERVSRTR
jgi:glucose/arabinose dehydrogenase